MSTKVTVYKPGEGKTLPKNITNEEWKSGKRKAAKKPAKK